MGSKGASCELINSNSNYTSVLNMPKIWLYQGSECTCVVIMSWFWICQGYNTGLWLCLNYFWMCLNMREYAKICLNGFALHFPFVIPCLNERVITYFNFHMNLEVIIWRSFKFGVTFRGGDGGGGARARGREYWYTFINIYTFDSDNSFCFFEHANELIHLIT